jgi:hypothetical protein
MLRESVQQVQLLAWAEDVGIPKAVKKRIRATTALITCFVDITAP